MKVPWAAALPPEAGRDAPPTVATIIELREHARLAADRLPRHRHVNAALEQVRGRARERTRTRASRRRVDVSLLLASLCRSFSVPSHPNVV